MRRFPRVVHCGASLVCAALFAGCASPWPDLPPREYSGLVVNASLNRPEPNATVSASRPGLQGIALYPTVTEEIGATTTDAEGSFRLKTKTGYATELHAESADQRLSGKVRLSDDQRVVLQIQPRLGCIAYRGIHPNSDTAKISEAAVKSIIADISAHPSAPVRSLRNYAEKGVITQEQLDVFVAHPELFLGPTPGVQYEWGDSVLVFHGATTPVSFRKGRVTRWTP